MGRRGERLGRTGIPEGHGVMSRHACLHFSLHFGRRSGRHKIAVMTSTWGLQILSGQLDFPAEGLQRKNEMAAFCSWIIMNGTGIIAPGEVETRFDARAPLFECHR